jgi:hypothetical protein
VDFCGDTPLIGATCAFSAASVPNVAGAAASAGTLTTPGSGTPKHTLKVTGLTMTAGTPFTITFTGMVNPSGTSSFYARILTYATGNASQYVQADTTGAATTIGANVVDAGGIALSTASNYLVTARVMESLTFCVYSSSCGDTPAVEIGTGSPPVIDSLAVYTNTTTPLNFSLSSNASNGVTIRLKGDILRSGTNNIPAVNAGGGTAGTITAGTAAFGVHVPTSTPGSVGVVNADANYDAATGYGLDTTSVDNITTTYGDVLCTTNNAPLNTAVVPITYGATANITTPAGVYTTTHQLIATGTF